MHRAECQKEEWERIDELLKFKVQVDTVKFNCKKQQFETPALDRANMHTANLMRLFLEMLHGNKTDANASHTPYVPALTCPSLLFCTAGQRDSHAETFSPALRVLSARCLSSSNQQQKPHWTHWDDSGRGLGANCFSKSKYTQEPQHWTHGSHHH